MEERRDYAVLRFVDQNGWSYMVNDYAKGKDNTMATINEVYLYMTIGYKD